MALKKLVSGTKKKGRIPKPPYIKESRTQQSGRAFRKMLERDRIR